MSCTGSWSPTGARQSPSADQLQPRRGRGLHPPRRRPRCRAPHHHAGRHTRRCRRVRRTRLGRRPHRRHRNPRRQQSAHPRHPRRSRRRELRRPASQGPTPPLFPTAAQPRRPQPGSRLAQPPEGLGLDPGEDDNTIPGREQPATALDREVPITSGVIPVTPGPWAPLCPSPFGVSCSARPTPE